MSVDVHVTQIHVAYRGALIPAIHRVDSFGKFGATALVDAAGVHPDIPVTVIQSSLAELVELGESVSPSTNFPL